MMRQEFVLRRSGANRTNPDQLEKSAAGSAGGAGPDCSDPRKGGIR